ncbi:hypothetical protein SNEBB_009478, partial [Seison nebaliae]
ITVLFCRARRENRNLKKMLEAKGKFDPNLPLNLQPDALEYDSNIEIDRDNIRLGEELGSGQYGLVLIGYLNENRGKKKKRKGRKNETKVAVKKLKETADKDEVTSLIRELKLASRIEHHPNIVNILGGVTRVSKSNEVLVVMEFCELGCLKDLLRVYNRYIESGYKVDQEEKEDDEKTKLLKNQLNYFDSSMMKRVDLLQMALEIASGMKYLTSVKITHRDLAARNVLVTSEFQMKVCDLGLAHYGHTDKNYFVEKLADEALPVKWMSPEAIFETEYGEKSDVWSFGIVLWELYTLGVDPYPNDPSSLKLLNLIRRGYRHSKPILMNRKLYDLMTDCTAGDSLDRPTFAEVVERLQHYKMGLTSDKESNEPIRESIQFVPEDVFINYPKFSVFKDYNSNLDTHVTPTGHESVSSADSYMQPVNQKRTIPTMNNDQPINQSNLRSPKREDSAYMSDNPYTSSIRSSETKSNPTYVTGIIDRQAPPTLPPKDYN